MTIEELLGRLRGVRQSGPGWEAHCPAHDDQKRSLSVAVGDSGALLLKRHAGGGCPLDKIVAALGITKAELFPAVGGAARHEKRKAEGRRVLWVYDYRDETGALLFQVVRYEPKGFTQRRPHEKGYIYDLNGVRRVLYRLPELRATDPALPVYVAEGEKDTDALAALGLIATTNPGGANKWRDDYSETLRGRHVVILPDNDQAGRDHAQQVTAALRPVAASVRVVELPGLPERGDVSDWLRAGGTRADLEALVAQAPSTPGQPPDGIIFETVASVRPQAVRWAWKQRIPSAR